jgi:hypothetical protein
MTNSNKFAVLVREISPSQSLFMLSEAVSVGYSEEGKTSFVVSSKANAYGNANEILIFPATATGKIIQFGEIGGSYEEESHATALAGMGFTLATGEESAEESAEESQAASWLALIE